MNNLNVMQQSKNNLIKAYEKEKDIKWKNTINNEIKILTKKINNLGGQ